MTRPGTSAPEPEGGERASRGGVAQIGGALGAFLAVVVVLCAFTFALYAPGLDSGVLSDGWHLLHIASQPVLTALKTRLSYHFIPVTHFINALLWRWLGVEGQAYQVVNLCELALAGVAVYALGCRIFRQRAAALLSALIFLANSSYYEIAFWAGVGNFQLVVLLLYVIAIAAATAGGEGWRRLAFAGLFAVCGLAAFFAYEPAITVFPVGVVAAFCCRPKGDGSPGRTRLGLPVAVTVAAVAGTVLALAAKAALAAAGDQALFLPQNARDLEIRTLFLVRGVLGLLTLRGSSGAVGRLFSLGTSPEIGQPLMLAVLGGWLLLFAVVLGWALLPSRPGAVRLAAFWLGCHVLAVSAAIPLQSRHLLLAAVPAALLSGWLSWQGAAWLANRVGRRCGLEPNRGLVAALPLLLLLPGAKRDLDRAAALHAAAQKATTEIQRLVRARLREAPPLTSVTLVNLRAHLQEGGLGAYFFVNGAQHLVALTTGNRVPVPAVAAYYTYDRNPPGRYCSGSRPISVAELAAKVRDPTTLVLIFDPATRRIAPAWRDQWRLPKSYTPDNASFLSWDGGQLALRSSEPLELPVPEDDSAAWVAVKALRTPGSDLRAQWGAATAAALPSKIANPFESTLTLARNGEVGPLTLGTSSDARVFGVWWFAPQRAYTPESSPFLAWSRAPVPVVTLRESVSLPLSTATCKTTACTLRLEYLAEPGRELTVAVDEGVAGEHLLEAVSSQWRTVDVPLPAGDSDSVVVRLSPRGEAAAAIRTLEVVASVAPPSIRAVDADSRTVR